MAMTLAEAAKLSNDVLLTGAIQTIVADSPVLQGAAGRLCFWEQIG